MKDQITQNWWVMALRGTLAVLLGIAAFVAPGAALALLVSFFGAYALVDGVFALVAVARWRGAEDQWWLLMLKGIVGIGVGIFVFVHPVASALALITLVGIWAVITGIIEIAAAIRLHRVITGEWLLGLSGALSIVFGIALLAAPGVGILVWITILGIYALMYGISLLTLAFRLRGHSRITEGGRAAV
ncbi:MAG: HdeD family acid-resistance protein [Janthinobacterium lividum]